MRVRPLGRLDEFSDYVRWRRLIRITHPEINDVLAALSCLRLEGVDNIKYVRRESFYAGKATSHGIRLELARMLGLNAPGSGCGR